MLFKNIGILDENFNFIPNQYVGISGEKIAYIGSEKPVEDYGEVYDGTGKVAIPAFVNSHGHTPMMYMRGYGENLALSEWLNTKIYPFESKWNGKRIYQATLLGIAEMIKTGTVSVTDMYLCCEEMCQAFAETGTKVNIDAAVVCFDPDKSFKDTNDYIVTERLLKDYKDKYSNRIIVDAGLHAEYTTTPKMVSTVAEYAAEKGLRINLHLSETKSEHRECISRHGQTPMTYFNELGVLDNPTTAAHCVWVDDNDIDIMVEKGVTVASCPVSNLKLASGVCPAPKMIAKGVNLALGTDSVASNNNLDMVEEMKFFATVHKGFTGDPTVISPIDAIKAATVNGAKGQGRNDCGLLKEGNKADIAVFDMKGVEWQPLHDVATQIVYAGSGRDVCLTMCDGKVLYKNGDFLTMDIEKVIYNATKIKDEILKELL